jgi:hypothetical protein
MIEADWNLRMGFSWLWNCVMGQLLTVADKLGGAEWRINEGAELNRSSLDDRKEFESSRHSCLWQSAETLRCQFST